MRPRKMSIREETEARTETTEMFFFCGCSFCGKRLIEFTDLDDPESFDGVPGSDVLFKSEEAVGMPICVECLDKLSISRS